MSHSFDSKARVDKPTRTASSSVASHKKPGRLSAEYDDDVQAYRRSQGSHCNRFVSVCVECFDGVEHANGSRVEDGDAEEHEEDVEEEVIELKSCDDEEESEKESSSDSKSMRTRIEQTTLKLH